MLLKMLKRRKGFTILEVLLSVAILSLVLVPMMFAIPSATKVVTNTQEELQLNQEMRSTILKVTDVIKDTTKTLIDSNNPSVNKTIDQIVGDMGTMKSKEFHTDFLKTTIDNEFSIKIDGKKSLKDANDNEAFGGKLYMTNTFTTVPEKYVPGEPPSQIRFDAIFINEGDRSIKISDLTFFYYYSRDGLSDSQIASQSIQPGSSASYTYEHNSGGTITYQLKSITDNFDYKIEKAEVPLAKQQPNANQILKFSFIPKTPADSNIVLNKYCHIQMHLFVQGPGSTLEYDNTNDYSYIPKGITESDGEFKAVEGYIGSLGGSAYRRTDAMDIYEIGKTIPVYGDDLLNKDIYKYKTDFYELDISLYNSTGKIVKTAHVKVSGEPK